MDEQQTPETPEQEQRTAKRDAHLARARAEHMTDSAEVSVSSGEFPMATARYIASARAEIDGDDSGEANDLRARLDEVERLSRGEGQ